MIAEDQCTCARCKRQSRPGEDLWLWASIPTVLSYPLAQPFEQWLDLCPACIPVFSREYAAAFARFMESPPT